MPKKSRRVVTPTSKVSELIDAPRLGADVDAAFGITKTLETVASRHLAENDLSVTTPHGHRSVPPEEDDPSVRDAPSMGDVVFTNEGDIQDSSDNEIRSLEDLIARYPFDGSGTYYIRVLRKKPRTWQGYQCEGLQRPITDNLTQQEFIDQYGGGEYSLIVYGPPRRGGLIDPVTGRLKPKALTKEVSFTVSYDPSGVYGYAPNPEATLQTEESFGETMEPIRQPSLIRRPATPADASMHRASLEDDRLREDRELNSNAVTARAQADVEKVRLEKEYSMQERAMGVLTEEVRQSRSNQGADPAAMLRAVAEVFKAQAPKDSSEHVASVLENSRQEISRMAESSKAELQRIMQQNEQERERLRDIHQQDVERMHKSHEMALTAKDREIAIERDRGDSLRQDLDTRHHRELETLKGEQARALEMAQREADRRVTDTERVLKAQIDAEAKAHERELRSLQVNNDSKLHTDKSLLDERLRLANEENVRLVGEVTRLQAEVKEKGDLPGQIQRFTDTASALGFGKVDGSDSSEGPKDWKDSLTEIAKEMAPRLPDMLRAAGEIVQRRGPAAPPQAPPMQQPMMHTGGGMIAPPPGPPIQRLPFATQDSDLAPQGNSFVAPTPVTAAMYAPQMQQPIAMQPPPQAIVPMPQPQMQNAPMAQMQPTTPPQPMQSQPPEEDSPKDAEILMFREAFEEAVSKKTKPSEFVAALVAKYGVDAVRGIALALKPERITLALQRSPEATGSPLLKFEGKRWIRETMKLAIEVKS